MPHMHQESGNLYMIRCECSSMHQQCKMSAARALVSVEDSYMKWNEGPTSMDVMTELESVTMHISDPPKSKRNLPPPRKVRSIHYMVPHHAYCSICCSCVVFQHDHILQHASFSHSEPLP